MATQPALMPIEQYLRTSDSPNVDFVDGVIEKRTFGEFAHARLQSLLGAIIATHEPEWAVIGVIEQRIRVASGRVRICDVSMLRAEAPREAVTETPPLICIEIMSPEDRLSQAKLVLADYLNMGVEHVWSIDPQRRAWYTFDTQGLHEQGGPLTAAKTTISVDVEALLSYLD